MGAVIVAEGGPVDSGVIEGRYVFDSGGAMPSPLDNPNPSHSVNFVFMASPRETLHIRWDWLEGEVGGGTVNVEATLNFPGATFYARAGERAVNLNEYEQHNALSGELTCQEWRGVGMEDPVLVEGVFRVAGTRWDEVSQ